MLGYLGYSLAWTIFVEISNSSQKIPDRTFVVELFSAHRWKKNTVSPFCRQATRAKRPARLDCICRPQLVDQHQKPSPSSADPTAIYWLFKSKLVESWKSQSFQASNIIKAYISCPHFWHIHWMIHPLLHLMQRIWVASSSCIRTATPVNHLLRHCWVTVVRVKNLYPWHTNGKKSKPQSSCKSQENNKLRWISVLGGFQSCRK